MHEDNAGVVMAGHANAVPTRPDIALDLLHELRTGRYQPDAWVRFVARSWHISRRTAREHPRLVKSWRRTAVGLTLVEMAMLAGEALASGDEGPSPARNALPGTALCLGCTLADAYVHLAMNNDAPGAMLHDTLGLPTILTLTRSALAGLLFGHLLGGRPARRALALTALAGASLTDVADGRLARTMRRETRLGAYLDGKADCGVATALTLTAVARRSLSAWLAAGLLARWLAPFAYALVSYFGQENRVRIGSTFAGKAAGVAQTATLAMALLPERVVQRMTGQRRALQVVTMVLLVAAPLAQFRNAGHWVQWFRCRLASRGARSSVVSEAVGAGGDRECRD